MQKIDPKEYQKRLDRITEIFAGMVTHADEQASSRCPYRDRHDRCTAKFRCGNQQGPSPGQEHYQCGHDGLIAAMGIVGIKFREAIIFVPEVLSSARAMRAGMAHIEPILSAAGVEPAGIVIMGTVKGDLHDIGKNLCIMMLRGSGFEVIDLGVDTSDDEFIDAAEENKATLVGMSALLTTTMPNMGKTIEAFIDADLRDDVQIMVGGAPVTQEFADDMGADGYGKDALDTVALAKRLIGAER